MVLPIPPLTATLLSSFYTLSLLTLSTALVGQLAHSAGEGTEAKESQLTGQQSYQKVGKPRFKQVQVPLYFLKYFFY